MIGKSIKQLLRFKKRFSLANNQTSSSHSSKWTSLYLEADRFMKDELPFLNSHFDRTDLATALNVDVKVLDDMIKENAKMSAKEYIDDYRFNYAIDLMNSKNLKNIRNVVHLSGFSNSRKFYRLFRQRYKHTPTEYLSNNNPKTNTDYNIE